MTRYFCTGVHGQDTQQHVPEHPNASVQSNFSERLPSPRFWHVTNSIQVHIKYPTHVLGAMHSPHQPTQQQRNTPCQKDPKLAGEDLTSSHVPFGPESALPQQKSPCFVNPAARCQMMQEPYEKWRVTTKLNARELSFVKCPTHEGRNLPFCIDST